MAINYIQVSDTPIANVKVEKGIFDDTKEHKIYRLTPMEGYVLHDGRNDENIYDDDYTEIIGTRPCFNGGSTTVRADYNFDKIEDSSYTFTDKNNIEISVGVKMVGEHGFYAVPLSIVPTDRIYGLQKV